MFDANMAFRARIHPRALAVVTPRRRMTYAEFDADVDRYAAALRERGVGPDSGVIALGAMAAHRRAIVLMALARLGAVSSVQADDEADLRISERLDGGDVATLCLDSDWIARIEAASHARVESASRDLDTLGRVTLSSGTLGRSKRLPQTWRQIELGGLNGLVAYASGKLGVWPIGTSLDSSLGFNMAVLAWSLGAAVALGYEEVDVPHLMERHDSGMIGMTPLALSRLVRRLPPGFDLKPNWRILVTGGLLPPAYARAARERLTPDIQIIYGSTEAGRSMVGPAWLVEGLPGAVGYAVPGVTVEVVDEAGASVPDGETGEIRIRSPRITGEYLGDEAASAKAFRNGWFYPGDMGRRLPSGVFVIDGRLDERMTVGATKVTPNVLENALLEHAKVRDCAAFAMTDANGLEECWIAVVSDSGVARDELLARLQAGGAPTTGIRFAWAEEIPRNAMGKIDRPALRAQTKAALEKGTT